MRRMGEITLKYKTSTERERGKCTSLAAMHPHGKASGRGTAWMCFVWMFQDYNRFKDYNTGLQAVTCVVIVKVSSCLKYLLNCQPASVNININLGLRQWSPDKSKSNMFSPFLFCSCFGLHQFWRLISVSLAAACCGRQRRQWERWDWTKTVKLWAVKPKTMSSKTQCCMKLIGVAEWVIIFCEACHYEPFLSNT